MPRQLTAEHDELIASGHCAEITTLILTLTTGERKGFTADPSADALTSNAHGLANGAKVMLETSPGSFLPKAGNWHLEPETVYYVRDAATNTFKLAEEAGGPALDITWGGSGSMTFWPVTVVHLATADVEHDGTLFVGHLHPAQGLKMSAGAPANRFAVEVQNADKAMGLAITGAEDALDGALAVVGVIHKNLETGATHYDVKLPGFVRNAAVDEAASTVAFQIVSDIEEAEYAGELVSVAFPQSDSTPRLPLPIDDLRPPADGPIRRPGGPRGIVREPGRIHDHIRIEWPEE